MLWRVPAKPISEIGSMNIALKALNSHPIPGGRTPAKEYPAKSDSRDKPSMIELETRAQETPAATAMRGLGDARREMANPAAGTKSAIAINNIYNNPFGKKQAAFSVSPQPKNDGKFPKQKNRNLDSGTYNFKNGISTRIRTGVGGMRTRCPRPLDDGDTS